MQIVKGPCLVPLKGMSLSTTFTHNIRYQLTCYGVYDSSIVAFIHSSSHSSLSINLNFISLHLHIP